MRPRVIFNVQVIDRQQATEGMWILPWIDPQTGLTATGDTPIPELITGVWHSSAKTLIVSRNAQDQQVERTFRREEQVTVVG